MGGVFAFVEASCIGWHCMGMELDMNGTNGLRRRVVGILDQHFWCPGRSFSTSSLSLMKHRTRDIRERSTTLLFENAFCGDGERGITLDRPNSVEHDG